MVNVIQVGRMAINAGEKITVAITDQQNVCSLPQSTDRDSFIRC